MVLMLATVAVLYVHARTVRAHFLMTPADRIPEEPELLRYAMAHGAPGYARHCAACHGERLQGNPARAVPNLADQDWLYGSGRVSEIEHVILYGIRSGNSKGWDLARMPAFATARPYDAYAMPPLSPAQIDDVTTYVLSLRQPQADAAAVARGARLFRDNSQGLCSDCHAPDAKGDSGIGAPDLTDAIWLRGDGSRESIEDTIAHGLAGSCPAFVARLPPETIRAIAVYVQSFSSRRGGSSSGARSKLE